MSILMYGTTKPTAPAEGRVRALCLLPVSDTVTYSLDKEVTSCIFILLFYSSIKTATGLELWWKMSFMASRKCVSHGGTETDRWLLRGGGGVSFPLLMVGLAA